ncbi:MAG: sulfurtransferase [Candidatus Tectomicrobia bacterium]|nr:sulfurtransferase [Candidatus Tectomicrobia bacterium]
MPDSFHPDVLVEPDWLINHLDDPTLRIVEIGAMGPSPYYDDGHIPGAIYWPWKESLWDERQREFVSPANFAALMSRSGVLPETTLLFYSSACQFATYALWTCVLRGHTNVKILNGSRKRWGQEGRPLTKDLPNVVPTTYPLRAPDESGRIRREGILAGLFNPDRILLDVRAPEEYLGERVSPGTGFDHGAERKGRIPGARHLFFRELLNNDDTFKSADELRAAFASREATPEKEVVVYCRLSHRASLAWFAARCLLEYPRVRSYDGSWTEWGSMVGMPIETGPPTSG